MFISDTSTFSNRKLFSLEMIKGIGNFYDGTGTTLKNAGVVVLEWHTSLCFNFPPGNGKNDPFPAWDNQENSLI